MGPAAPRDETESSGGTLLCSGFQIDTKNAPTYALRATSPCPFPFPPVWLTGSGEYINFDRCQAAACISHTEKVTYQHRILTYINVDVKFEIYSFKACSVTITSKKSFLSNEINSKTTHNFLFFSVHTLTSAVTKIKLPKITRTGVMMSSRQGFTCSPLNRTPALCLPSFHRVLLVFDCS